MNGQFRVWDTEQNVYVHEPEPGYKFFIRTDGTLCEEFQYGCSAIVDQPRYEVEFAVGIEYQGKPLFDGDVVKLSYGIPVIFDTLLIKHATDEVVDNVSVSGWWMRNLDHSKISAPLHKDYDLEIVGTKHDKEFKELCK